MEHLPPDLIVVGRVGEAYGLKGGLHLIPYSVDGAALLAAREWWLEGPGGLPMRSYDVMSAKPHGAGVTAQLVGLVDRDVAEKLKGAQVYVPRSRFPALADDEYYWADLIGLEVVNLDGDVLGTVSGLIESGAHPILEVAGPATAAEEKPLQRLIPFVGAHVIAVERPGRCITVDWGLDY